MTVTAQRFQALDISPDKPGFFDSPAFLAAEQHDGELLHDYARYVYGLRLRPAELSRAERIIRVAARFLHGRLVADGRLGACVDIAMTLSRFLEREGVWSVAMGGALQVDTPIGSTNFGPISTPPPGRPAAGVPHAWVFAPPFAVVDLSIKQQPYPRPQMLPFLPDMVLDQGETPGQPQGRHFFDAPDYLRFYAAHRRAPTVEEACARNAGIRKGLKDFQPIQSAHERTTLTYIPIAGVFPDLPLETATNLVLSGQTPIELYHDYKRELAQAP